MENDVTYQKSTCLLPVVYLGTIEYFAKLIEYPSVLLEHHEHYVKQTYRNRCRIYGANGKLNIIIPVQHTGKRMLTKDVKISYNMNWQKIHWRSLVSAYRSSPYFEFYEDALAPFYHKRYDFLIDFNRNILNTLLKLLELEVNITKTSSYQEKYDAAVDCRKKFSLKHYPYQDVLPRYIQVFSNKHGFIPNLSIVDLLFNKGAKAKEYLKGIMA